MKNLKRIMGFMVMAIATFGFTGMVSADEITSWETFKSCLTASDGDKTCTVGEGTITAGTEDITVTKNITLDLGGKTVELKSKITVSDNASLTVSNGTLARSDRSIIIVAQAGSKVTLDEGAILETKTGDNVSTFTIYGSDDTSKETIVNINAGATVKGTVAIWGKADPTKANGVTLNVKGTIDHPFNSDALTVNGNVKQDGENAPEINIFEGALIKAKANGGQGIYAAGYAKWNITGGEISGREGIGIKSGKFNIKNAIITGMGAYVENPTERSGYPTATGAGISITANDTYDKKIEITIGEGTEVYSENGVAVFETKADATETAVNSFEITGGYFEGKNGSLAIENNTANAFKNSIKGGAFASEIDRSLLAENSKAEVLNYSELEKASSALEKALAEVTEKTAEYDDDENLNIAEIRALQELLEIFEKYSKIEEGEYKSQAEIDDAVATLNKATSDIENALQFLIDAKDLVTFIVTIDNSGYEDVVTKGTTLADYKKNIKDVYDVEKFLDKDGKELSLDTEITDGMELQLVLVSPETGDNILTYVGIGAVSLGGIVLALRKKFVRE